MGKQKRLRRRIRELECELRQPRPSLPASVIFNGDTVTVVHPGAYLISGTFRMAGHEFSTMHHLRLNPGVYPIENVIKSVRLS